MAPLFFYLSLIGRGSIRFHRTGVEKRKGRKRDKRKRDRAWITGSDFFSGGNRFEGRGRWRRLWARETRLRVARAQIESEENRKVAGCWPLYTRIERSFGVDVEKRRCRATMFREAAKKGEKDRIEFAVGKGGGGVILCHYQFTGIKGSVTRR